MKVYLVIGIIGAILMVAAIIMKRRSKKERKLIPYVYKGTKIFLTEDELEVFNGMTRTEKRRSITQFKAKVSNGDLIPVYEKSELIGYIRKQK